MAQETFVPTIEAVEATLDERRDKAWGALQTLIVAGMNAQIDFPPAFYDALHAFSHAHINVLIDQQHYEEEVEPYEFMREKLAKMTNIRPERRRVIFSEIRAAVSNTLATRVIDNGQKCNTREVEQIITFYRALNVYARLLLSRKLGPDDVEKSGITLAGAFADRLVFQATQSALCGDPYFVIHERIRFFDVFDREMAIATIADRATRILIASAAAVTEMKPRKSLPEAAVTYTFAPSASAQQKVLVQRGKDAAYQYLVRLFADQVQDGDTVIEAADGVR